MHNGLNGEFAGQESLVTCLTGGSQQLRANCLRLNRHEAVFEVFTPHAVVRASEVLTGFKITINGRSRYDGRATVKSVISGDTSLLCEATLADDWIDVGLETSTDFSDELRSNFAEFVRTSMSGYKILPEFKLVVADLQTFLVDFRHWVDQAEFGVHRARAGGQSENDVEVLRTLDGEARPLMTRLFERFEESCLGIDSDLRPAHAHYVKRQLHPIVLCAPFMYRSFQKPLGYAGDYEMINMMVKDPFQGSSAFARVLNSYFLSTPPVVAHRHRVMGLLQMLQEEACRHHSSRRPIKVLNLGCGPALEIQEFMAGSELSDFADFTLLDFNDETIQYVSTTLQAIRKQHHRKTVIACQKKSVVQLLKEAAKPSAKVPGDGYDVIYCAGLFDYLTASVCQRLMATFYTMLAPGGLLVATNVFAINPSRQWMDYSVDWHLIYRDHSGMREICPKSAPPESCVVKSDPTGLNLFVEVRKPADD